MLEDIASWDQEREDYIYKKREIRRLKKEAEERERLIQLEIETEERRQARINRGEEGDEPDKDDSKIDENKPAD